MTIVVTCQCGKAFRAEDEHAGLQAACPACGQAILIPGQRSVPSPPSQPGQKTAKLSWWFVTPMTCIVVAVLLGAIYAWSTGMLSEAVSQPGQPPDGPKAVPPARGPVEEPPIASPPAPAEPSAPPLENIVPEPPIPAPPAPAEPSARPLENGVLIDNDVSVAYVNYELHQADKARPGDVDSVDITLAFRRVSGEWLTGRRFQVIITDDRAYEYPSDVFRLDRRSVISGMYGLPLNIKQMPAGFTCTGTVKVPMPLTAPIAKVELERTHGNARRFAMNISKPTVPDFEFDIPSQMLLSEGTTIEANRDLRSKVGHLAVHDSIEKGLSLSLPIAFENTDGRAQTANVPQLSVQFENGVVITKSDETVMQSAQLQDSGGTLRDASVFEIPGKSTRTLVLRVDVAARMNAEASLNIRMILLYANGDFRGFVPIPDDARQRIREIAGKGKDNHDNDPGPDAAAISLSGRWKCQSGRVFHLDDDGETVTVRLVHSLTIQKMYGILIRDGAKLKAIHWYVLFKNDRSKTPRKMKVEATIVDSTTLNIKSDVVRLDGAGREIFRGFIGNARWKKIE